MSSGTSDSNISIDYKLTKEEKENVKNGMNQLYGFLCGIPTTYCFWALSDFKNPKNNQDLFLKTSLLSIVGFGTIYCSFQFTRNLFGFEKNSNK